MAPLSMASALTPHGIKLAIHIISTDFGNLVSKVCECLLRRGTLTLALICRFTELPQHKVKKCLWVLIQHNSVQAFALEQEGGAGDTTLVVTQYMALFNNIIHRLRFPKFITIAKKELGDEVLEIFDGLLQHGRLTLSQILDRALGPVEGRDGDSGEEKINELFNKLVHNRLVERCPNAEPLISLPNEDEAPVKKGGGRSKMARREVTIEERALAASIPMDAERFSTTSDLEGDFGGKDENKSQGSKVGEKRKQDTAEWDSELDIMGGKKEPLWRVNFSEFINRLRIKVCVEYAREEYDNNAAVILNAMLEGTKGSESTVSLSLDSIFEEVIKTKEGLTMNLERIRCSLRQMDFCNEANDVYSINLKNIIVKAQSDEVESIVKKRYGIEAFRMFRSLANGRALDTDKISERTFVDKKTTPQVLYKLWKDNYIQMEKVTTGGPRQMDFFLWSVNKNSLWHHILDEMYHAALNLSLRYAHEVDQERELLQIQNFGPGNITPELEKRKVRLRNVRILLDSSLMKLDDAIMLFHDFLI